MPADRAWLAPLLDANVVPAARFEGDASAAVWLPNERVAKAYAEYISDGDVSDTTPPPAPTHVRIRGHRLTWDAVADLESGVAQFVVERDGTEVARVPEKPSGRIGRPLFQEASYHDTPTTPLPEMRLDSEALEPGGKHQYTVRAINSVGLRSAASR